MPKSSTETYYAEVITPNSPLIRSVSVAFSSEPKQGPGILGDSAPVILIIMNLLIIALVTAALWSLFHVKR